MKIFLLPLLLLIVLTGCFLNSNGQKFDDETVEKAKETVESYLKNNYEGIKTIEFDDDYSSPMGGMMISGKVNDKAEFSVSIDQNFFVGAIGEGEGFPERKEECRERTCDY